MCAKKPFLGAHKSTLRYDECHVCSRLPARDKRMSATQSLHQPLITLSLIAAMAQNGVIGRNNQLPWHLPADLKHFKALTWGKPVLMGRRTFESIGKPLPGRTTIVVTRDQDFTATGVEKAHSVSAALALATDSAVAQQCQEIMLAGGASLYQAMLPLSDRMYITQLHTDIAGDAYFPTVDWSQWQVVEREDCSQTASCDIAYSFIVYERRP